MSERGAGLERKTSRQLDEIIAFLRTLREEDLERPDPDRPGRTVGEAAAHMAESYHHLGRLLDAQVLAPGLHPVGHVHGRGPELRLSDIMDRAVQARAAVNKVAELTDEQLDIVPAAGTSRFSDGRRTFGQIIEAVIDHQGSHLTSLQAAVRKAVTPAGPQG